LAIVHQVQREKKNTSGHLFTLIVVKTGRASLAQSRKQTHGHRTNKNLISTHHKIIIINITRDDQKNSSAGVVVKKNKNGGKCAF
jgi:hypothetical protein